MDNPYQVNLKKAGQTADLYDAVRKQLNGNMDMVRTRAYWETVLPDVEPAQLAEALTWALHDAATSIRKELMQQTCQQRG